MKPKTNLFSAWHLATSLLMVLALFWLTISTPFVFSAQKQIRALTQQTTCPGEDTNPFSSTTEEKNESGVSSLSEYLHDMHNAENHPVIVKKYFKCHPSDEYIAFHPEYVSPPPKA